jgi:hypothetical protein
VSKQRRSLEEEISNTSESSNYSYSAAGTHSVSIGELQLLCACWQVNFSQLWLIFTQLFAPPSMLRPSNLS